MQETNESKLTIVNGVVERCEKTVAGRAVIPEGVTRIGEAAFKDCIGLQWVRIPSTVTEIGSSAFEGCLSLQVRADSRQCGKNWSGHILWLLEP